MCCDLEKLSFIEKLASWNKTCKKITVPSTMTKCDKDVPMSNQDPWSVTKKKNRRPMMSERTRSIRKRAFCGIWVTCWTENANKATTKKGSITFNSKSPPIKNGLKIMIGNSKIDIDCDWNELMGLLHKSKCQDKTPNFLNFAFVWKKINPYLISATFSVFFKSFLLGCKCEKSNTWHFLNIECVWKKSKHFWSQPSKSLFFWNHL